MSDRLLVRSIIIILCAILFGVMFQAPISVLASNLSSGQADLVRTWKELLMGVCLVLVCIYVTHQKKWQLLWQDWIIRISAAYAIIHGLLLAWQPQGINAASSGIILDVRYVLMFVLCYVVVRLLPQARRPLLITAIIGASSVLLFALLQVTILPKDILAQIGYSKATISPYLTVDLNPNYIRINSTLRGPNPLGAFGAVSLALLLAFLIRTPRSHSINSNKLMIVWISLVSAGMTIALWYSYSRSAAIGAVVAVVAVVVATQSKRVSRGWWTAGAVALVLVAGIGFAAKDTPFVANVILHDNPNGGSEQTSDEGHAMSLRDGTLRMIRQPLGAGIGSTGSASLRGDEPFIVENQYLYIAHETGWVGLGLFLALFVMILRKLWQRRQDWLALGIFAGGLGLAVIGLLLPVWSDDTVSIVWWGLAGIAIGGFYGKKRKSN